MVDGNEGINGIIVASIATAGGILIAWIKGKYSNSRKINELQDKLDEVNSKFESFKLAFEIVFDQMERDHKDSPEQIQMLKDLRKSFNL